MNVRIISSSNRFFYLAFFVILIVFIAFKISDLHLPYFWDEAWSYFPVIYKMAQTSPALFPNDFISPEFYRGHPLLFYFLSALWMKTFGSQIWISKCFPLFISFLYLFVLAIFAKKFFNRETAIVAVLFTMVQSVFFVQSSLLLPEILLALFTLCSVYFYLLKKRILSILFLTLALYTKETAIVIWICIVFFEFLYLIKAPNTSFKHKIVQMSIWLLPILLVSIFFIIQYFQAGWVFFPEHIGFISSSSIFDKLSGYAAYMFIYHGRNLLTIAGIFALMWLWINDKKSIVDIKKPLFLLSFFIFVYLLFLSINFYSPRYVLSILPIIIMLFCYFITQALKQLHWSLFGGILLIVLSHNIYNTLTKGSSNDHTLGYRNIVSVHAAAIHYCEQQQWHNEPIYTHFLMYKNMTMPELGYLLQQKAFTNVTSSFSPNRVKYAIISSVELDNLVYEYLKANAICIKRFEKNKSWAEIYKLNKN